MTYNNEWQTEPYERYVKHYNSALCLNVWNGCFRALLFVAMLVLIPLI